jgi:hypothetical protein
MFSAGTPDAYVEIGLALRLIAGEEEREKVGVSADKLLGFGGTKHIIPDSRIAPVLRSEVLHEMWISQKTDVDNEIAIEGDSVFKPKGEKIDPHA